MEQMKEEQYNHYKGTEENIKQRLNSLKYNLQQDIIKIKDPVKAKEIAEEEHAFLHIPFHDLIQEKRIGQGGFADVYHGRWLSRDHEVAIKVIRIQFLDDRIKGDLVNEISMMHQIHYDHILNIFGACMEPNNYALIVEYMSLGSLYDILRQKRFQLTWSDRCSIANQMTKGINYLHKLPRPILHRDIKSLNILMTEHGKGFLVKVADFGLAKIRHETSRQSSRGPSVGTLPWKAPELLKMGRHTEASDVYALGVVFWELCTECEPYEEADDSTISAFVMRGGRLDIPTNIPKRFADLISSAWAHEPQKRPNCQQLLNLIKPISSEIDENKISQTNVPPVLKKNVANSDETVSPQQRSRSPERPKKRQYEIGAEKFHSKPPLTCNGCQCVTCGRCCDWYYTGTPEDWQWIRDFRNWDHNSAERWRNGKYYDRFKLSNGAKCNRSLYYAASYIVRFVSLGTFDGSALLGHLCVCPREKQEK
ncbi:unnamed protein product [Rotaria socialis]|uniref:Protein kinase domain-containing protein n=2 Tax=Rotaria socialis TaxID=392032 RepID=A0A818F395_9BILA|nr:unnamed protein product [Rotaria socialis]